MNDDDALRVEMTVTPRAMVSLKVFYPFITFALVALVDQ